MAASFLPPWASTGEMGLPHSVVAGFPAKGLQKEATSLYWSSNQRARLKSKIAGLEVTPEEEHDARGALLWPSAENTIYRNILVLRGQRSNCCSKPLGSWNSISSQRNHYVHDSWIFLCPRHVADLTQGWLQSIHMAPELSGNSYKNNIISGTLNQLSLNSTNTWCCL